MAGERMMRGFPPPEAAQVTLANWRLQPWCRWAFHHVREIIPTAPIRGGGGRGQGRDPQDLLGLAFDDEGRERTLSDFLPEARTDSMVVLRGGRLAWEWYDGEQDGHLPHILFSVSKSVTGTLTGCLIERGYLAEDDLVTAHVPEAEGSAYDGATVRNLLDMSIATPFEEEYLDPDSDYMRYRVATGWNPVPEGRKPVWLREFLTQMPKGDGNHGHDFKYLSPNTDMLGWVLERAAGRRYSDLVSEHLWRPMGARGAADVTLDPLGAPRPAGGISCTPRDLARFGDMIRTRGVAGGRQVVPGWWVDDILTAGNRAAWNRGEMHRLFPGGCYRSKWYQSGDASGAFAGIGIHGQWIWSDPEAEVTIAVFSSQNLPVDDPLDHRRVAAFRAVCDRLTARAI